MVSNILEPLCAYTKENRFKQYFFDVGLLGALSKLDPFVILKYDYGSYKGYLAENFVAQELVAADLSPLYCWEGKTSEIEFVLQTKFGFVPLEVKSGWVTQSKSLQVYNKSFEPKKRIILSAKNVQSKDSLLHLPLYATSRLLLLT